MTCYVMELSNLSPSPKSEHPTIFPPYEPTEPAKPMGKETVSNLIAALLDGDRADELTGHSDGI